jgi:hypothetical protein
MCHVVFHVRIARVSRRPPRGQPRRPNPSAADPFLLLPPLWPPLVSAAGQSPCGAGGSRTWRAGTASPAAMARGGADRRRLDFDQQLGEGSRRAWSHQGSATARVGGGVVW